MSDEEINQAIAEHCGWRNITSDGMGILDGRFHGSYRPIPNYCGSLDAMQEPKQTLTPREQDMFAAYLGALTDGRCIDFGATRVEATTKILFATARQEAEAFLRTVDKWRDA